MASIKYDVKLLTEKNRKRIHRKQLKEGDVYCGQSGMYRAVIHATDRTIITLNLATGVAATVGLSETRKVRGKRAPTLHLVGVLAKDSLKLIKR